MENIIQHAVREKDRLFYNRYQWCIDFHVEGASVLRNLNARAFESLITLRTSVDTRIASYYHRPLMPNEIHTLYQVRDFLLCTTTEFKKVLCYNYIYIYTNDYDLISKIAGLKFLNDRTRTITEVRVTQERDVILLKNPRHKLRSYLKWQSLSDNDIVALNNFFEANADEVRPSPTLKRMLKDSEDYWSSWTRDWDFVDHQTESQVLMLNLICGQIIRKTMKIKAK